MPNWCDVESEDLITCKDCGVSYDVDTWHTCQQASDRCQRENEAWERNYKGKGRIQGQLVINFECYDSEGAIDAVISDAIYSMTAGMSRTFKGKDKVLEFAWNGKITKVKK